MNTEKSTETDFPISPEQMRWPFRTEERARKDHQMATKTKKT